MILRPYQRLLVLLATMTDRQLAKQVQFLKAENDMLRSRLPGRITPTSEERRRLIKLGKPLGKAIEALITIVRPSTFAVWLRKERKGRKPKPTGRPRTIEPIRDLVLRIARETGWGYTRILGELRKLTKRRISRQTVKNILLEHGLDPGPKRGEKTWDEFVSIHAQTLWQCDFFTRKIWTTKGLRDYFVLVFLHVQTRTVFVTPATAHPNTRWMIAQADAFYEHIGTSGAQDAMLFHDRARQFSRAFVENLKTKGFRPRRLLPQSPNMNAFVERWIQSIQQECLNHFVVFGERHLNHLVSEYVAHYHTERPHQGADIGNRVLLPGKPPDDDVPAVDMLVCRQRLGGLLKSYERAA